jgi:capsular polysaccharide biosynthesis protein
MENIVKLLSSEKFSEELMEGMEGVPANKYLDEEETRLNPEWKAFLKRINSSVHFAYVQSTETADAELSRSFIYVNILVEGKGNQAFAEELLYQIEQKVPDYVMENMVVPGDYAGTNCQKTSVLDEVERTNGGYAKRQAIKFALLIGAALFVIACVVVVVLQRMDNRLRHYQEVSKKFDVPVLGVLPTIED